MTGQPDYNAMSDDDFRDFPVALVLMASLERPQGDFRKTR